MKFLRNWINIIINFRNGYVNPVALYEVMEVRNRLQQFLLRPF